MEQSKLIYICEGPSSCLGESGLRAGQNGSWKTWRLLLSQCQGHTDEWLFPLMGTSRKALWRGLYPKEKLNRQG